MRVRCSLITNDFNPLPFFISAISIWSSSLLKILLMPHLIAVTPADTLSNEDELSHVSNISGLDEEDTPGDTADEGIPASRARLRKRGKSVMPSPGFGSTLRCIRSKSLLIWHSVNCATVISTTPLA